MINGTISSTCGWNISWQICDYSQTCNDCDGKNLKAANYTAMLTLQKGRFSFGPGIDYLSGNDPDLPATENQRFDPLYGTPHKHWGYMDYYYVGTGSPVGGLLNPYFKLKYQANNFFVTVDAHNFRLAERILDAGKASVDKNLKDGRDVL